MSQGNVYAARGMKVVADTYWDSVTWKYLPKDDGSKTVECTPRTALEDVTNVPDTVQFFH